MKSFNEAVLRLSSDSSCGSLVVKTEEFYGRIVKLVILTGSGQCQGERELVMRFFNAKCKRNSLKGRS